MRLLTFRAARFAWQSYSQTLDDLADETPPPGEAADAVVVFMHVEAHDQEPERRRKVFKHTLKHIKWLANKRDLRQVVLHSFTHLGGVNADPAFAKALMGELDERLTGTGYQVQQTPFGWFSSWEISVHGDSLAKVYKEI